MTNENLIKIIDIHLDKLQEEISLYNRLKELASGKEPVDEILSLLINEYIKVNKNFEFKNDNNEIYIINQGSSNSSKTIKKNEDFDFVYTYGKTKSETWKIYLEKLVKDFKDKFKTNDVANSIILSNKDIPFKYARIKAADIIPELVKDGILIVEKGKSKKEGNSYRYNFINQYKPIDKFEINKIKKRTDISSS